MPAPRRPRQPNGLVAVREASAAAVLEERANTLARRAWEMRQAGSSWWEIAEELQVGEDQAKKLMHERITAASDLVSMGAKQDILLLELTRLDALQRAIWPEALRGTKDGIDAALKIMAARSKLLGLETALGATSTTNQTVIVAGTSDQYVAALRAIAGQAYTPIEQEQEAAG